MKSNLTLLIFAFLFASCQQNRNGNTTYDNAVALEEKASIAGQSQDVTTEPAENIEIQEEISKKIIKDGRINIRVADLQKTKVRTDSLVKKHGGYYAGENFNNSDWESSFNLKIRIPFSNFEKFIAEVESGNGEILFKEIAARDVTDQFIDLETRLENKRSYLQRYNELLRQAKTIKEILEIEEKIRVLEEEIESTTGRLKYLGNLVDYSTLDLTLTKQKDFKYNPAPRDKFTERLKQSLSKGWFGFVDFLIFLIRLWPFLIILAVLFWFWKRYRIRRKKK